MDRYELEMANANGADITTLCILAGVSDSEYAEAMAGYAEWEQEIADQFWDDIQNGAWGF